MSSSTTNTVRETSPDGTEPSTSLAGLLLFAVGLGGVIGFATAVDDWIAAGFIFLVMCTAFIGYRSGAARIAAGIAGMLIAIRFAAPSADLVAPYVERYVELPPTISQLANVLLAGSVIALVVYLAVRVASGLVLRAQPKWQGVNRWFGAALGVVQGMVISCLLLFSLVILEPIAQQRLDRARDEPYEYSLLPLSAKIVNWSAKVRLSLMGTLMEAMDPLRVRFDDRLQEMTQTISAKALNEPTIQAMLPDFIEKLRSDPQALEDLSARTGLDEQTLRTQLNNLQARPIQ